MRVEIPKFEDNKALFAYLKENKESLINKKRSLPIYADAISFAVSKVHGKPSSVNKSAHEDDEEDEDKLRVKVVANTANFIDSHMDMLLPDAWAKSISERKELIPHLHDHIHSLTGKVGEVVDIFSSTLSFSELGLEGSGSTQSLVFITDILKSYNEKIFNQYKIGGVNQHSIGLQYVKLDLAINDEDSEKEFEFWTKHLDQAINKEVAEERGFFWVVQEIKLLENSAVLFGSNPITPTLDNNVKDINTQDVKPGETTSSKESSDDNDSLLKQYLLS